MTYKAGQIVEGIVTGIQPYGAFVKLKDGTVGLIHISELSDDFVRAVEQYVCINQKVIVKVIEVDSEHKQLRFSLKAVHGNCRKHPNQKKIQALPEMKIGFKSIQDKMPIWIKEIKND